MPAAEYPALDAVALRRAVALGTVLTHMSVPINYLSEKNGNIVLCQQP